jgi:hypothetical protein
MEQNHANAPDKCPRCGAEFTCGLAAQQERCWCFDMPKVKLPRNQYGGKCLCPKCLREAIDAVQKSTLGESVPSNS